MQAEYARLPARRQRFPSADHNSRLACRHALATFRPMANPSDKPLPSGLVTFMFTDIVNSTAMKGVMPGNTSQL